MKSLSIFRTNSESIYMLQAENARVECERLRQHYQLLQTAVLHATHGRPDMTRQRPSSRHSCGSSRSCSRHTTAFLVRLSKQTKPRDQRPQPPLVFSKGAQTPSSSQTARERDETETLLHRTSKQRDTLLSTSKVCMLRGQAGRLWSTSPTSASLCRRTL